MLEYRENKRATEENKEALSFIVEHGLKAIHIDEPKMVKNKVDVAIADLMAKDEEDVLVDGKKEHGLLIYLGGFPDDEEEDEIEVERNGEICLLTKAKMLYVFITEEKARYVKKEADMFEFPNGDLETENVVFKTCEL